MRPFVSKATPPRGAGGPGPRRRAVGQAGLVRVRAPGWGVPRTVFWPVPNVDSGLVAFRRRPPPDLEVAREEVFAVVDVAFAQRRKTLRAALARWAGGPDVAERILRGAGVDPGARGESLTVAEFTRIARQAGAVGSGPRSLPR